MRTKNSVIILFLLIKTVSFAFSQGCFQSSIASTQNEENFDFIALPDGGLIMTYIASDDYTSYFSNHFVHMDNQGKIIKELVFSNPDGDCIIQSLLSPDGVNLVGIGSWDYQGVSTQIWYVGLDTSLTVNWNKKYILSENSILSLHSFINDKNNIITGAQVSPSKFYLNSGLFFMASSLDGDSITSKYMYSGDFYPLYDILQQGVYYKALSKVSIDSWTQILTLDTNFNAIYFAPVPDDMINCMSAKLNNDTSLFICGNIMDGAGANKVGILKSDRNNNAVTKTYLGKEGIVNYAGAIHCIDFIEKNHIFVTGTSNVDLNNGPYSSKPSWYLLSSLDSLLNVRWTKYYGGDVCYLMRSIVATTDGGAIMAGTRYDYQHPENKMDIFVIKVNQDGIYTSTEEPIAASHDAIICPNPGHDYLEIRSGPQINGGTFSMYDLTGKKVMEEVIDKTQTKINTSYLPLGTYLWQIIFKNKVIENGKWVKGS